jgi:hypothetical protein
MRSYSRVLRDAAIVPRNTFMLFTLVSTFLTAPCQTPDVRRVPFLRLSAVPRRRASLRNQRRKLMRLRH